MVLLHRLVHRVHQTRTRCTILYEMCFNFRSYSNEVYYTIFQLLQIMLCSKLHCQDSFRLKHISYQIGTCLATGAVGAPSVWALGLRV